MGKISIKPEREYLREVTAKLKEEVYAIPAFQRDFVWKDNQVIELFDSISKGYPIGSIILWKPKKNEIPMMKDVITEEIKNCEETEYFILDGRQRTTAYFGCIYEWEDKPEIFHLYYSPEQDTFVYKNRRNERAWLCAVSDVFDTFKMLGLLQQIQKDIKDEEKARIYIERVKDLNTIFQQYEIGEVIIDNCTLEESSTVFSRINSKGTDISKVAMLQARTYKDKNSVLLADSINNIISELSDYGFGEMKSDDVLNCCYRYIGRNFYDNKVSESLVKADLANLIPRLRKNLTAAVRFLNERCGVINYRLLPYNRQLVAATAFFMEKSQPTEAELKELERWFFYTTYQQTFLNGSLGNVRKVFRDFEDYLNGKSDAPINYHKIDIDNRLDFTFSLSSAQSNFISLCQVLKRRSEEPDTKLEYCGVYRYSGNRPANSFLLLTSYERDIIKVYLSGEMHDGLLDIYFLDEDMLANLNQGKTSMFFHLRKRMMIEAAKDKLLSLGLEVEEETADTTESMDKNIAGLISEFADLNNEEKRELCELLGSQYQHYSVIYQVADNTDGTFTIGYGSFDRTYKLSESAAQRLLRKISDGYCNGENPADYYSWLISIEKD